MENRNKNEVEQQDDSNDISSICSSSLKKTPIPSTLSYSRYSLSGDSNNIRKSALKTPSRASIQPTLTPTSKFLSTSDLITPIKSNDGSNINLPTFLNDSTSTPLQTPLKLSTIATQTPRNRVVMSEVKPTIHTYPSSPLAKPPKSKLPNITKFLNRSSNINDTTIIDETINDKNVDDDDDDDDDEIEDDVDNNYNNNKSILSSISSKYYRNQNNNGSFTGSPISDYYPTSTSVASTSPNSFSNKAPKIRKKPLYKKIQDLISYPFDKIDEIQENIATFHDNQYYKTLIYLIAIVLNLFLFSYSIELFNNNLLGLILILISIINSIVYFKSSKKSYLYRFEGTHLGPNMSIEQIDSVGGNGTKDNVVVLNTWNPKFPSKILFNFFSPLHLIIMYMAKGPDFEKFVTYSILSIVISFSFYFFSEVYEQKIKDEKVLFTQVCMEYNHFMKAKPIQRDKGTQTTTNYYIPQQKPLSQQHYMNEFIQPYNNNKFK